MNTVVDDPFYLSRMIEGIPGRAPDAGHTEFGATTLTVVEGTIHLSPCMAAATDDSPSSQFRVLQSLFDFFRRVLASAHSSLLEA